MWAETDCGSESAWTHTEVGSLEGRSGEERTYGTRILRRLEFCVWKGQLWECGMEVGTVVCQRGCQRKVVN